MTVRPTTDRPRMQHKAAASAAQGSFAAPLAALLLALLLSAFPLLSAQAVEEKCMPEKGNCKPAPSIPKAPVLPAPTSTPAPEPTPDPAPVIRKPAPTTPPPAPAPAPTADAPSPRPTAAETESASPSPSETATTQSAPPSPSHTPWTPSATATTDSNWTKPIDDGNTVSQAALVNDKPGTGPDLLGILAIMAGVLVAGLGGLAFAMWSRNRIGSH